MTTSYKPRVNSLNSYFLQKLRDLAFTNINGLVERQKIKEQVKDKYNVSKNKVWDVMVSVLQSNCYIVVEIAED